MERIFIRYAKVSDIGQIHAVNKECLPLYYATYELMIIMSMNQYFIVVAENETIGKIIGFLIARIERDNQVHILSFGVSQNYRKHGIGTKLIKFLQSGLNLKYRLLTLYVHTENVNAIRFYKKNGFVVNNIVENYYLGSLKGCRSYDAYFMVKLI